MTKTPDAILTCAHCGLPRREHHYNGGCYGICGEFIDRADAVMAKQPPHRQSEHAFQVHLIKWLESNGKPELIWIAVANGELRHPRVALRLKAEGVRPGVSDLCFILPNGKTGWLELKAPKGGSLSAHQKGFAYKVQGLDHYWACVRNMEEAILVLRSWGVAREGTRL